MIFRHLPPAVLLQIPLPEGDSAEIDVPLPEGFERWRDIYLHTGAQKLLVFVALAVLLYFLYRLVRRSVATHIEDVNQRHVLRKGAMYGYVVVLLLLAVALFADLLTGFGTFLAVILAGIAVALQDVLKSLVGWLYMSTRSGVGIGSRIEVEGVVGDVIDIGVLKTTLLEVGNLVYGRQSTGRLVTIPNHLMLSASVFSAASINPFVWQEMRVLVTYESDWERAEEILRQVAGEVHDEIAPELERGFRKLERRFAFKYGTLTPIVYVTMADSGVDLTLRYLSHVRRRRGSSDRISRQLLHAFEQEPNVELAYPTYRMFRLGEHPPGRHGAADMHLPSQPSQPLQTGEEGLPPPDMIGE